MAAISQKVPPEEVLPLLARNVAVQGYNGPKNRQGRPTEFLILLKRYVDQARELLALAGSDGAIRVSDCDGAKPLLAILGYRLRLACGKDAALETANPERAFLTIDSGFPLAELEEALGKDKPFVYPFSATRVPVLFTGSEWTTSETKDKYARTGDVVDFLLRDSRLARLYWAMARMDTETRNVLLRSQGLRKVLPFAPVLDFYGSQICIRFGRVIVPGGAPAESAWKDLVGASPASPGDFVIRLIAKDQGWLAAYFDVLARVNHNQQAYFTQPRRLRRFYEALRGREVSPGPAVPVFRPDAGLLLLGTRLQLEPTGEPHVPGSLEVWKEFLRHNHDSELVRDWAARASHWHSPEQLVEAMFASSRRSTEVGPLQIYLLLCEIDHGRSASERLGPQTVLLLADKFERYNNQYRIFSEFPELNDASITRFLTVAEAIDRIPNVALRANALGILQANVGLWQILGRQGQIPSTELNDSWQRVINPFARVLSSTQLFDAGRASLGELWRAAASKPSPSQDEFIALLAGPKQASADGQRVHQELANRIRAVLDDQRLVPFDRLFALGDGLNQMAHGKPVADSLIRLAEELHEFELPRPIFTTSERSEWAPGIYENRHSALQSRTDLPKIIKSPGSARQLTEARGLLAPFLRDTLVGLNYAYYEPPGSQLLHTNPLLVRSHDFSGVMSMGGQQSWQLPHLYGSGLPASGGAHLAGSLADLPYVLAEVEQDFIVPENVQALIWEELVPGLLTSAVLPRWWAVTGNELHAVTLYQRAGEELLAAAVENDQLRQKAMDILSECMLPQTTERVEAALRAGRLDKLLPEVRPADTFYLAAEFRRRFPGGGGHWGAAGQELEDLSRRYPAEVSWERLSEDFGVPHPALTQSYTRELLNLKPFPAFTGYASRLLAESWESNNLYWSRLADEMGYSPVMLNRLVPELTRRMVEKIFATHFEDWPAMLRALQETGEEFRQGKIVSLPKNAANREP